MLTPFEVLILLQITGVPWLENNYREEEQREEGEKTTTKNTIYQIILALSNCSIGQRLHVPLSMNDYLALDYYTLCTTCPDAFC